MLNKNKLLILIGALIVLIAAIVIISFAIKNNRPIEIEGGEIITEPINLNPIEFMSDEEKARFEIPLEAKIQVLKKKESGEADVYKIIRTEADIILDPSRLGDPNMLQPKKTTN